VSLESVGWILMGLGLVLFVCGYLKASKRIDVKEHSLPRVTEQEKREALAVLTETEWAPLGLSIRVRPSLYDWEREGQL
jgi:hypothetical protein